MLRLQDDEHRRIELDSGYRLCQAARADGIIGPHGADWLAQRMQELYGEDLIDHGPRNIGAVEPALWNDYWIQSLHGWRVTSKGRADVAVHRSNKQRDSPQAVRPEPSLPGTEASPVEHDVFISHASEDKERVAQPLAAALVARGWKVWLDELELTVGDSLHGSISTALAQSRFGVVILSPAFFAKQWPQRELAGLAAREVNAGTKVILPVWHDIDSHYLAERAPILADRLGALTDAGIDDVADKLSLALTKADLGPGERRREPIVQAVAVEDAGPIEALPTTPEAQRRLAAKRPKFWEYLLFAGCMKEGFDRLEPKWHDHELRLPRGERRELDDDTTMPFLRREMDWARRRSATVERILNPSIQERAFGAPGEHGDPEQIALLARRIIDLYEAFLDWAASLRNAAAPAGFVEVIEATASMLDEPTRQTRSFIEDVIDQMGRVEELAAGATEGSPVVIALDLRIAIGEEAQERFSRALARAEREINRS